MIVIPMAGLSQRFTVAGYDRPKYMLEAHGKSLFDHAVLSFAEYFDKEHFLFVARQVADTGTFIEERCKALGIYNFQVVLLDAPTRGQAETVALGLNEGPALGDVPLTIFNIDTFRPGFRFPDFITAGADGYLETFIGAGNNWSFVRPKENTSNIVAETTEKLPISHFCCTGLYHFARMSDFILSYEEACKLDQCRLQGGELYIAPLYNHLISCGRDIRFTIIARNDVTFCGIPSEYEAFLR